jgi:hypothetical protein
MKLLTEIREALIERMPDSPDTSAVAIVQDHAFEPRETIVTVHPRLPDGRLSGPSRTVILTPNEALCRHCRLAEAAHTR